MFNLLYREKITEQHMFVEFLKEKKSEKNVIRRSATCEEKLHRKFPPSKTRRFNFQQSDETRYGLFTDT